MTTIKNKKRIVRNGGTAVNQEARRLALESLEFAVNSVDPRQIIRSRVQIADSKLQVNGLSCNLGKFTKIHVIGGGKATAAMAEALEQILNGRITDGLINVPRRTKHHLSTVKVQEANHPVPDEEGRKGAMRMLEIAENAGKDDLIICLISGGGSSLMPLPRDGISISDKRRITDALLKCGATISEINTVRKHISDFKGGWLAKKAYPATILNLILSDVLGDPLDFIASGPTVPDSTTFSGAVNVLNKYNIWDKSPPSIKRVLSDGVKKLIPETPKKDDPAFKRVHTMIVGNNRIASTAACKCLNNIGLNSLLLTSVMEGEARQVGTVLASIAREVSISENPVSKPAGLVAGGETTVTVLGEGLGGRNQEITLAAALKLQGFDGVAFASVSTDGVDGPTDAAGAIADGKTVARALKSGLDPDHFLTDNDSYHFFAELGDLLSTGPTGTNVNDVSVVVIK